ncbi:unnamed protein product [Ectocarpus fasciculatus]
MSSRVAARPEAIPVPVQAADRGQAVAAAAAAAPSDEQEGVQQIGFDDALFLFVAEGRRPHRKEMIVFCLGFAASLSLVFITSDLMNGRRVHPGSIIIFVLSVAYCGVLIRRQRIETARLAAEEERLAEEEARRRRPPGVVDKETRRRVLNYFVLRPPEEKHGDNNHKSGGGGGSSSASNSAHREGDISGSGRGIRFPKLARGGGTATGTSGAGSGRLFGGVFSPYRAPAPGSPPRRLGVASPALPPPPPYASPPPTREGRSANSTAEIVDQERTAVEREEGLAAAAATLASDAEADTDGGTNRPAGGESRDAAAAGAAAGSETDVVVAGASVGEKAPGAGDEGSSCPRTDAEGGVQGDEAKGEGSTGGSCIVCFGDYTYGEELCRLRCGHLYHAKCIDEWLDGENHGWCPLCKTAIMSASGYLQSAHAGGGSSDNNNNAVRSGITGQATRRWGRHMPNNNYTGNDAV